MLLLFNSPGDLLTYNWYFRAITVMMMVNGYIIYMHDIDHDAI